MPKKHHNWEEKKMCEIIMLLLISKFSPIKGLLFDAMTSRNTPKITTIGKKMCETHHVVADLLANFHQLKAYCLRQ